MASPSKANLNSQPSTDGWECTPHFSEFLKRLSIELAIMFSQGEFDEKYLNEFPESSNSKVWLQAVVQSVMGLYASRMGGQADIAASFTIGGREEGTFHDRNLVSLSDQSIDIDDEGVKCLLAHEMIETHKTVFHYIDHVVRTIAQDDPQVRKLMDKSRWSEYIKANTGVKGTC